MNWRRVFCCLFLLSAVILKYREEILAMSASTVCRWADCHWKIGDGEPHFEPLEMHFSLRLTYLCLSGGLLVYLGHFIFI